MTRYKQIIKDKGQLVQELQWKQVDVRDVLEDNIFEAKAFGSQQASRVRNRVSVRARVSF